MVWVALFAAAFVLVVIHLARVTKKAGPRQLDEPLLAQGQRLPAVNAGAPGVRWQRLGRRTQANGLNLKFEHNDNPAAEATLLVPGSDVSAKPRSSLGNRRAITIEARFRTEHVHTGGYVFQVRLRGSGQIVGKEVCLLMIINAASGEPWGGRIENDDDTDAAIGDWLEIESAEIMRSASA